MSRIGKLPITIPDNVNVNYSGSEITVKGKFGTLQIQIPGTIGIQQEEGILRVSLKNEARNLRSLHGLYRTLINNMIIGVSKQFVINLELKGVGYRCQIITNNVILDLGYSHPIKVQIPNEISITVKNNTFILITGINKEQVGLFASKIRSFRPPEP